jgi:uncharacterized protein YdbL (DUF1318 family)
MDVNSNPGDLNVQLKALAARLDRVDEDLISHYAGISQLVTNLSMNPLVSGNVAQSLLTYNFSSSGQQLVSQLMSLIPGVSTFKQLQHMGAAGLVGGMLGNLQGIAGNLVQNIADQALEMATSKINAEIALVEAQAQGLVGEALQPFEGAVSQANSTLAGAAGPIMNLAMQKANAEVALSNAVRNGIEGETLSKFEQATHLADGLLDSTRQAESAISGLLGAMSKIASHESDSLIIK